MRRLRPTDQKGFTLIELLVAMTVLAVVTTLAYRGLETINRNAEGATDRLQNLDEARLLMDTVTKDLRTAVDLNSSTPAFISADDRTVTFYGNLNSTQPRKIEIFVDAQNRLVERVTLPSGSAPFTNSSFTGTPIVRIVGRFVSGTDPIFTYIHTSGTEFTADQTPLPTASLTDIGTVGVSIAIQKTSRGFTNATVLEDRVRLPNILNNLPPPGS
jgi:prepilin-type N-terminal cleavage/methylation domain-containing protein